MRTYDGMPTGIYDETTLKTATWFFYYDAIDRLTEVRYTPDISSSSTYSFFSSSGWAIVSYSTGKPTTPQ
jgi:hypothetical protein